MESSRRPTLPGVVATTFAGVIVGVTVAGYLLVKEVDYSRPVRSINLGSVDPIVPLMVIDAALVAVVALLALYWRYRSAHDIRAGVLWVGLGLVAGGLIGIDGAVGFAVTRGYSSDGSVIGAEVGIVAAGCVAGIGIGGQAWLSTRRRYAGSL
jgi:hypothetical protein